MALTLASGDHLAAAQDAGTDVAYEINGDLRTISGSTNAYGSLAQGTLTSVTSLVSPSAGTDLIIDSMALSNPGASTRVVTFYKTKGSTTYNATTQWGPAITLLTGESAQWGDAGWTIYASTGLQKTNASTVAVGAITGLGTGVGTALAVNVGTAGSPVTNGGALGTPSSGTLASCTRLPIAGTTGYGT